MKLTLFFIYTFLLAITFVLLAVIWHWQMSDVYFVSHGKGMIADFLPPFIHPGESGDFYIKPRRVVYIIWAVYIGCIMVIPAVGSWLLARLHQHALNKSWM